MSDFLGRPPARPRPQSDQAGTLEMLVTKSLDPMAVIREPLIIHETASIFRVLDQFKKAPVRLAMVIDEYGSLDGIVTQTDLLEAIAGDLPDTENEEPDIIECAMTARC
jgi:CBS domain containing-hemolysin-like protein